MKQQQEEEAARIAKARAELAASLGKPHRPVMREKSETSVTLALSRDGKKVDCVVVVYREFLYEIVHLFVMHEKSETSITLALSRKKVQFCLERHWRSDSQILRSLLRISCSSPGPASCL